jgi:hypothetical protein
VDRADANAELTVPGRDLREQPGLTVHRDLLADDEITDVGGLPITTAWQQTSDARRLNALDAAGWSVLRFTAADVLRTPDAMAA